MSSGRLPLDSSYRKLIDQASSEKPHQLNFSRVVAWANLNANWIMGQGWGILFILLINGFYQEGILGTTDSLNNINILLLATIY